MGPHDLEPQKTREGEEGSRGCLCRGVRSDKEEQPRQRNPPGAVDNLKVVEVGACTSITVSRLCYGIYLVNKYQRLPENRDA